MNLSSAKNKATHNISKTAKHPAVIMTAKLGFVVAGLLHMMIGWIAFKIATGSGGGEASNSGAMAQVASTPGGQIFLWIMTIGLLTLGLWRLASGFLTEETKDKAKGIIVGIVYLSLGLSALGFARGGSSSDGQKTSSLTANVLEIPGGKLLIGLVGAVIIGVGIYQIFKGATRRFKEDLEVGASAGKMGDGIVVAGTVGYVARGIAFLVLGGLVIAAAWTAEPEKAAGMDSALRTIGQQPFGAILLILAAIGFFLYGIHSMARAKYTNEI